MQAQINYRLQGNNVCHGANFTKHEVGRQICIKIRQTIRSPILEHIEKNRWTEEQVRSTHKELLFSFHKDQFTGKN